MLETRALCKSFGGNPVTRDVSIRLEAGERRVILGPNGAGKTTLFNLLAGTLPPSSGDILLEGRSIARLSAPARARAGLARSYQKNTLFDGLTIRENLSLAAARDHAGWMIRDSFRDARVRETVAETAERTGLADLLDTPVSAASYGARRQLEVGLALATRPRLLLMDEPTSGIGPAMIEGFHALLHALPREITLLIIEHDMDLALDIADRVTVMSAGAVVFEGTPEETRGNAIVREIYTGEPPDA